MIKVIIVDDDESSLDILETLLKDNGNIKIAGCFTNPQKALLCVHNMEIDAIFLDIDMLGIDGLEMGKQLKRSKRSLDIVYLSSHKDFAINAFNLGATHYLLKPLDYEQLDVALARIQQRHAAKENKQTPPSFFIQTFGGLHIYHEGKRVYLKWTTKKTEELFSILLLSGDYGIDKWLLMSSVWPTTDPEKAQQNLYTTLTRMKKNLADIGLNVYVDNTRSVYRMRMKDVLVDFIEFEKQTQLGMSPLEGQFNDIISGGIALYRGQLFGDNQYYWCETRRMFFKEAYKDAFLLASYIEKIQ